MPFLSLKSLTFIIFSLFTGLVKAAEYCAPENDQDFLHELNVAATVSQPADDPQDEVVTFSTADDPERIKQEAQNFASVLYRAYRLRDDQRNYTAEARAMLQSVADEMLKRGYLGSENPFEARESEDEQAFRNRLQNARSLMYGYVLHATDLIALYERWNDPRYADVEEITGVANYKTSDDIFLTREFELYGTAGEDNLRVAILGILMRDPALILELQKIKKVFQDYVLNLSEIMTEGEINEFLIKRVNAFSVEDGIIIQDQNFPKLFDRLSFNDIYRQSKNYHIVYGGDDFLESGEFSNLKFAESLKRYLGLPSLGSASTNELLSALAQRLLYQQIVADDERMRELRLSKFFHAASPAEIMTAQAKQRGLEKSSDTAFAIQGYVVERFGRGNQADISSALIDNILRNIAEVGSGSTSLKSRLQRSYELQDLAYLSWISDSIEKFPLWKDADNNWPRSELVQIAQDLFMFSEKLEEVIQPSPRFKFSSLEQFRQAEADTLPLLEELTELTPGVSVSRFGFGGGRPNLEQLWNQDRSEISLLKAFERYFGQSLESLPERSFAFESWEAFQHELSDTRNWIVELRAGLQEKIAESFHKKARGKFEGVKRDIAEQRRVVALVLAQEKSKEPIESSSDEIQADSLPDPRYIFLLEQQLAIYDAVVSSQEEVLAQRLQFQFENWNLPQLESLAYLVGGVGDQSPFSWDSVLGVNQGASGAEATTTVLFDWVEAFDARSPAESVELYSWAQRLSMAEKQHRRFSGLGPDQTLAEMPYRSLSGSAALYLLESEQDRSDSINNLRNSSDLLFKFFSRRGNRHDFRISPPDVQWTRDLRNRLESDLERLGVRITEDRYETILGDATDFEVRAYEQRWQPEGTSEALGDLSRLIHPIEEEIKALVEMVKPLMPSSWDFDTRKMAVAIVGAFSDDRRPFDYQAFLLKVTQALDLQLQYRDFTSESQEEIEVARSHYRQSLSLLQSELRAMIANSTDLEREPSFDSLVGAVTRVRSQSVLQNLSANEAWQKFDSKFMALPDMGRRIEILKMLRESSLRSYSVLSSDLQKFMIADFELMRSQSELMGIPLELDRDIPSQPRGLVGLPEYRSKITPEEQAGIAAVASSAQGQLQFILRQREFALEMSLLNFLFSPDDSESEQSEESPSKQLAGFFRDREARAKSLDQRLRVKGDSNQGYTTDLLILIGLLNPLERTTEFDRQYIELINQDEYTNTFREPLSFQAEIFFKSGSEIYDSLDDPHRDHLSRDIIQAILFWSQRDSDFKERFINPAQQPFDLDDRLSKDDFRYLEAYLSLKGIDVSDFDEKSAKQARQLGSLRKFLAVHRLLFNPRSELSSEEEAFNEGRKKNKIETEPNLLLLAKLLAGPVLMERYSILESDQSELPPYDILIRQDFIDGPSMGEGDGNDLIREARATKESILKERLDHIKRIYKESEGFSELNFDSTEVARILLETEGLDFERLWNSLGSAIRTALKVREWLRDRDSFQGSLADSEEGSVWTRVGHYSAIERLQDQLNEAGISDNVELQKLVTLVSHLDKDPQNLVQGFVGYFPRVDQSKLFVKVSDEAAWNFFLSAFPGRDENLWNDWDSRHERISLNEEIAPDSVLAALREDGVNIDRIIERRVTMLFKLLDLSKTAEERNNKFGEMQEWAQLLQKAYRGELSQDALSLDLQIFFNLVGSVVSQQLEWARIYQQMNLESATEEEKLQFTEDLLNRLRIRIEDNSEEVTDLVLLEQQLRGAAGFQNRVNLLRRFYQNEIQENIDKNLVALLRDAGLQESEKIQTLVQFLRDPTNFESIRFEHQSPANREEWLGGASLDRPMRVLPQIEKSLIAMQWNFRDEIRLRENLMTKARAEWLEKQIYEQTKPWFMDVPEFQNPFRFQASQKDSEIIQNAGMRVIWEEILAAPGQSRNSLEALNEEQRVLQLIYGERWRSLESLLQEENPERLTEHLAQIRKVLSLRQALTTSLAFEGSFYDADSLNQALFDILSARETNTALTLDTEASEEEKAKKRKPNAFVDAGEGAMSKDRVLIMLLTNAIEGIANDEATDESFDREDLYRFLRVQSNMGIDLLSGASDFNNSMIFFPIGNQDPEFLNRVESLKKSAEAKRQFDLLVQAYQQAKESSEKQEVRDQFRLIIDLHRETAALMEQHLQLSSEYSYTQRHRQAVEAALDPLEQVAKVTGHYHLGIKQLTDGLLKLNSVQAAAIAAESEGVFRELKRRESFLFVRVPLAVWNGFVYIGDMFNAAAQEMGTFLVETPGVMVRVYAAETLDVPGVGNVNWIGLIDDESVSQHFEEISQNPHSGYRTELIENPSMWAINQGLQIGSFAFIPIRGATVGRGLVSLRAGEGASSGLSKVLFNNPGMRGIQKAYHVFQAGANRGIGVIPGRGRFATRVREGLKGFVNGADVHLMPQQSRNVVQQASMKAVDEAIEKVGFQYGDGFFSGFKKAAHSGIELGSEVAKAPWKIGSPEYLMRVAKTYPTMSLVLGMSAAFTGIPNVIQLAGGGFRRNVSLTNPNGDIDWGYFFEEWGVQFAESSAMFGAFLGGTNALRHLSLKQSWLMQHRDLVGKFNFYFDEGFRFVIFREGARGLATYADVYGGRTLGNWFDIDEDALLMGQRKYAGIDVYNYDGDKESTAYLEALAQLEMDQVRLMQSHASVVMVAAIVGMGQIAGRNAHIPTDEQLTEQLHRKLLTIYSRHPDLLTRERKIAGHVDNILDDMLEKGHLDDMANIHSNLIAGRSLDAGELARIRSIFKEAKERAARSVQRMRGLSRLSDQMQGYYDGSRRFFDFDQLADDLLANPNAGLDEVFDAMMDVNGQNFFWITKRGESISREGAQEYLVARRNMAVGDDFKPEFVISESRLERLAGMTDALDDFVGANAFRSTSAAQGRVVELARNDSDVFSTRLGASFRQKAVNPKTGETVIEFEPDQAPGNIMRKYSGVGENEPTRFLMVLRGGDRILDSSQRAIPYEFRYSGSGPSKVTERVFDDGSVHFQTQRGEIVLEQNGRIQVFRDGKRIPESFGSIEEMSSLQRHEVFAEFGMEAVPYLSRDVSELSIRSGESFRARLTRKEKQEGFVEIFTDHESVRWEAPYELHGQRGVGLATTKKYSDDLILTEFPDGSLRVKLKSRVGAEEGPESYRRGQTDSEYQEVSNQDAADLIEGTSDTRSLSRQPGRATFDDDLNVDTRNRQAREKRDGGAETPDKEEYILSLPPPRQGQKYVVKEDPDYPGEYQVRLMDEDGVEMVLQTRSDLIRIVMGPQELPVLAQRLRIASVVDMMESLKSRSLPTRELLAEFQAAYMVRRNPDYASARPLWDARSVQRENMQAWLRQMDVDETVFMNLRNPASQLNLLESRYQQHLMRIPRESTRPEILMYRSDLDNAYRNLKNLILEHRAHHTRPSNWSLLDSVRSRVAR